MHGEEEPKRKQDHIFYARNKGCLRQQRRSQPVLPREAARAGFFWSIHRLFHTTFNNLKVSIHRSKLWVEWTRAQLKKLEALVTRRQKNPWGLFRVMKTLFEDGHRGEKGKRHLLAASLVAHLWRARAPACYIQQSGANPTSYSRDMVGNRAPICRWHQHWPCSIDYFLTFWLFMSWKFSRFFTFILRIPFLLPWPEKDL